MPSKLGAPNNENISQGKWRRYSISDILTSKNDPYSKFGMVIVNPNKLVFLRIVFSGGIGGGGWSI